MDLVEEASKYLDGDGRKESLDLERGWKIAYARETMHLTNRLMKVASWLLLVRARSEGELSRDAFLRQKSHISLVFANTPEDVLNGKLPETVVELIYRSQRIMDEIRRIDKQILPLKP
jgi:regulator of CtrA degradation